MRYQSIMIGLALGLTLASTGLKAADQPLPVSQTFVAPPPFNGDRNVMVTTEYELGSNPSAWIAVFQQYEKVAAIHASGGSVRYWMTEFAGDRSARLLVTVEYPGFQSMADNEGRLQSSSDYSAWLIRAAKAGIVRKSRSMMTCRDRVDSAPRLSGPRGGPDGTHVIQIIDIDISANPEGFPASYEEASEMNARLGSSGQSRLWRTAWSGNQIARTIATVEFPSLAEMAQSIAKVDSTPEFQRFAAGRVSMGIRRNFEMIAREVFLK